MKFTKKTLAALLTASCIAIAAFGFAACNNDEPKKEPVNPKPPVGPTDKENLNDGKNDVTFTADNAEVGILYTYTAAAAGTYAFAVEGAAASVKVGENAVTSYVAELEAGAKVEFVCASATDETASYYVYAGKASALSIAEFNTAVAIPAQGTYSMYTVDVAEAGEYRMSIHESNILVDYALVVNGESTTATWFNDWAPVVSLTEGKNVIALATTASESGTVDISFEKFVEVESKELVLGDNTVNANYNGVEYTFTAPETANYTFSVDTANDNIYVDVNEGNTIGNVWGEVIGSVTVALESGQEITVNCLTNTEESTDTYNINIEKSELVLESTGTIELYEEKTFGVDDNNATTVTLSNAEAGTYYLSIYDLEVDNVVTVTVNGGEPQQVTVVDNPRGGAAYAMVNFDLSEAADELTIVITSPAGTTSITLVMNYYAPEPEPEPTPEATE